MARSTSSNVAVPGTSVAKVPPRSTALNLLLSVRPGQWTKNLLVFAGLLFGLKLFNLPAVFAASGAFVIFCALSGAIYLINDVSDRESDRQHPLKARRPIASGALSTSTAIATAIIIVLAGLAAGAIPAWRGARLSPVEALRHD